MLSQPPNQTASEKWIRTPHFHLTNVTCVGKNATQIIATCSLELGNADFEGKGLKRYVIQTCTLVLILQAG